jgi:hypothetical protein
MADEKLNIELASHGFEKKLRQLESDLNVQKTESIPVNYSDKLVLYFVVFTSDFYHVLHINLSPKKNLYCFLFNTPFPSLH